MAEAIWVSGRVPNGYWSTRSNRVKYLHWLGRRLGFRTLEDWHQLTRQSFIGNYGGGLLATAYGDSPLVALRDLNPRHSWKPWLMASTPQRFWRLRANRQWYLQWLRQELGCKSIRDCYRLSGADIKRHDGGGLLQNYYGGSMLALFKDLMPQQDWKPWRIRIAPQSFWRDPANRREYVLWLGEQLRYRRQEDWYAIRSQDFVRHHGMTLLMSWAGNSVPRAVMENLPEYDWNPWLFTRVPKGYWSKLENRKRYVLWLGKQLGFKTQQDWRELTAKQVRANAGGTLFSSFYGGSLTKMLWECLKIDRAAGQSNSKSIIHEATAKQRYRRGEIGGNRQRVSNAYA